MSILCGSGLKAWLVLVCFAAHVSAFATIKNGANATLPPSLGTESAGQSFTCSHNARCGPSFGKGCLRGWCCSSSGWCGTTSAHCDAYSYADYSCNCIAPNYPALVGGVSSWDADTNSCQPCKKVTCPSGSSKKTIPWGHGHTCPASGCTPTQCCAALAAVLNTNWDDLTGQQRTAAMTLGHTKTTWDGNQFVASDSKSWSELTGAEKNAAKVLGYDEAAWDKDPSDTNWDDLTEKQRAAAMTLGHTKTTWDGNQYVASYTKIWSELTGAEKNAAKVLGYDEAAWDNDPTWDSYERFYE